jgi:hypothetical protein
MNKIPVGETISKSYEFGFGSILSVFGVAWFPHVLLLAICAGCVFLLAPGLPRDLMSGNFDPMQLLPLAHVFGLIWLVSYLVTCMVTVGIQDKALGRHPDPVFFYFSLGPTVWRMVLAAFLVTLVIGLIIALTAGVTVGIWFAAGTYAPKFVWPIRTIAIIAACCWVIYMMVRLTFFLPAVVVAEERIGLGRSWELGGGNFWRIAVVAVAVFVPVSIAFSIVFNTIFGAVILSHIDFNQDPQHMMRQIIPMMITLGPLAIVLGLIRNIIYLGLGNGMAAKAYLAVTGDAQGKARTFA